MNEVQKLKFYQKGTLTVGNRLVNEAERNVQASRDRSNSLTSGHRACQGCGEALGARYAIDAAMRAAERNLIAVNATGCLEVFTTPYPETSWQIPWMHSLFGNAAAVATGVAAAMRVTGKSETARRRAGRRRGHDRHRLRLPLRHVRAQRRRALYLLRQRGIYEHGRSAVFARRRRPRAPRPRRRWAQSLATFSAPASSRPRSRWRTTSPMSRPPASPTCTISRPRSPRRWVFAARATFRSTCRARSAGERRRRIRSSSPGSRSRPASSRSSRRRAAMSAACARSAARRQSPNI